MKEEEYQKIIDEKNKKIDKLEKELIEKDETIIRIWEQNIRLCEEIDSLIARNLELHVDSLNEDKHLVKKR